MKKSLTALAVLGVFAGSAMAADVTLYGALDTGLEYYPQQDHPDIDWRLRQGATRSTCRMVGIRATAGA